MARKFASTLTDRQYALARAFERAGLCSISQAVKAFERREDDKIEAWKRQLSQKEKQQS
jgi:predicted transcriptional regulator